MAVFQQCGELSLDFFATEDKPAQANCLAGPPVGVGSAAELFPRAGFGQFCYRGLKLPTPSNKNGPPRGPKPAPTMVAHRGNDWCPLRPVLPCKPAQ